MWVMTNENANSWDGPILRVVRNQCEADLGETLLWSPQCATSSPRAHDLEPLGTVRKGLHPVLHPVERTRFRTDRLTSGYITSTFAL